MIDVVKIEETESKEDLTQISLNYDNTHENFSYYEAFKEVATTSVAVGSFGTVAILNNFISLVIIANINEKHLAASALIDAVQALSIYSMLQTVSPVGTIISRNIITKGKEEADDVLRSGLVVGLIVSIPAVAIELLSGKILILFGQSPELIRILNNYFIASAAGVLPCILIYTENLAVMGM